MISPFRRIYPISAFGQKILRFILFSVDLFRMLSNACMDAATVVRVGRRPVFQVLMKQIYFTGVQALSIILAVGSLIGIVIIAQVMSFSDAGSGSMAGKFLVWAVVREIAPLLTAMIVIGRSGTAISTELGQMKLAGEIEVLESLGIPPAQYLIMPRVAGVTLAVVILAVYFALASLAGGFFIFSLVWHIPFEQISQGITSAMTVKELMQLFVKAGGFGIAISLICCRQGLGVGRSATHIPQAATGAVIRSLFAVFILDGIITFFFSNIGNS